MKETDRIMLIDEAFYVNRDKCVGGDEYALH